MGYDGEDRNGATHEHHSTTDKTYKPRQGVSSVSLRIWVLCQVKAGLTGVYTHVISPQLLLIFCSRYCDARFQIPEMENAEEILSPDS